MRCNWSASPDSGAPSRAAAGGDREDCGREDPATPRQCTRQWPAASRRQPATRRTGLLTATGLSPASPAQLSGRTFASSYQQMLPAHRHLCSPSGCTVSFSHAGQEPFPCWRSIARASTTLTPARHLKSTTRTATVGRNCREATDPLPPGSALPCSQSSGASVAHPEASSLVSWLGADATLTVETSTQLSRSVLPLEKASIIVA